MRRPLTAFFALTFAISWGIPALGLMLSNLFEGLPFSLQMYTPLYFVGVWGPALAALLLIGRQHGAGGVGRFLSRMLDWRFSWRWWLFSVAVVPAMYFLGALAEHAWGTPGAIAWYDGSWLVLAGAFLLRATAGPVEELGWRGYALPLLQQRMSPWVALLLLAGLHALWHAPVFFVGQFAHFGTPLPLPIAFGRFLANILVITVFLNIAYNATGGKLTLAFLIHWTLNGVYPWEGEAETFTGQVLVTGVVALLMLVTVGRRWLSSDRAATALFPDAPAAATSDR